VDVKITTGWQNIGKYGYAHYAGECLLEEDHRLKLVPQSIVDGWQGFCRCGEWAGFASLNDGTREQVIASLQAAHADHVKLKTQGGFGVFSVCWQDMSDPRTYDFRPATRERFATREDAQAFADSNAGFYEASGGLFVSEYDAPPPRAMLPEKLPPTSPKPAT
jgi:hypothetical protein